MKERMTVLIKAYQWKDNCLYHLKAGSSALNLMTLESFEGITLGRMTILVTGKIGFFDLG